MTIRLLHAVSRINRVPEGFVARPTVVCRPLHHGSLSQAGVNCRWKAARGGEGAGNRFLSRPLTHKRLGSAMIAAIVTLTIIASGTGMLVKTIVLRHQQLVQRQWHLQSQLLAEAALARAEQRLASNAAYEGETWSVKFSDASLADGQATITVSRGDDQESGRISVTADVPADPVHHARTTLHKDVPVNPPSDSQ